MRPYWIASVLVLALFSFARQALATPSLPITDGLLAQLDATDTGKITLDGSGNVTGWSISQGSATGFLVAPVAGRTGATYSAAGGGNNNLPCVTFPLGSVLSQNGGPAGGTTPKTVFVMENTTAVDKYGGIWGRYNRDRGIRFNNDNPAE
ncbi:MAG: hypothetical protein NT031_20795, partial [Planctomycetota bacterium]|nr:hypothetical protein [Planctomycetota bacterium]